MTDKRSVLILTIDAGLGHRNAAEALAVALAERYGDGCAVEVLNPADDERAPGILRSGERDYDRIVQDMSSLYRLGYQVSDGTIPASVIETVLTVALFTLLRNLIERHRPDGIITTIPFYQAPVRAVLATGGLDVPLITVVTDLVTIHRVWFSQAADLCAVPTEPARDLALSYGLQPEKVEVTGIPVDLAIAGEDRESAEIRAELGWRRNLPTLLAVGGKRVENQSMLPALQALNHAGFPLQLAAVAGGDDDLYRQFQEIEWHAVTHVYNFVHNMPALMRASDLILCKAGGLIVSEALASGLPLVLIDVIPGQEVGNAEYVVEGGAGERAGGPLAALETVYHWLENDGALLAERTRNARRLGRPRAAFEIAGYVWRMMEEFREGGRDVPGERSAMIELLDRHDVSWRGT